ncbi:calcium-binding protein [Azospirillum baldaniorum]|uniref:Calcium-binding protein n=1 Tax=Azospirillum baldaniorum TaxID=1064539 RepID=A0A9P1NKX6_9PROT|nr:calcium-binding protein [Azospirillum baldaniorum]CCC96833.1 protein of unknown function [Azospirillum baldaniorum]
MNAIVAGAESRVNTHTPSSQGAPDVTVLPNGNYVVTWHSLGQDNNTVNPNTSCGVYSQLYRADGTPIGGESLVNTYTLYAQYGQRVTALSDGRYLIVWQSENQDGSGWGTYGQRFAADGSRIGDEFRVNANAPDTQYLPSVAGLAGGGFVASWTYGLNPQSHTDIHLRRFDAFGNAVTGDVLVNGTTAGHQDNSEVVGLSDGGFLVLWQSQGQDGSGYGLYARRYTAAGVAQPEFRINTTTAGDQSQPAVAVLGDGGLVVAWQSAGQDGSGSGIVLQRYDALGQAVGGEVVVNTTTAGAQTAPDVIALADGGYLVGWVSANQDGSGLGIYAQRFDAVGNRVGGEIAVTQATLGDQVEPAFAATADGGWIATWSGYNPATGTLDVMQRRFTVAEVTVTVTAPDRVLAVGQPVAAATLFSVASDAPAGTGVVIQSYEFTDLSAGGGHFLLDGVTQAANTPIVLAGDQLHRLTYVANATTGGHDTIRVRAFDGTSWAEDTAALAATAPRATVVAGAESRVNTHTPSSQGAPDVTVLPNGNYVVMWHSLDQDNPVKLYVSSGVYAQLYSADGTPIGGEVLVNTYTPYMQMGQRVTALPDGGYLIVWHSEGQDGHAWGVYAQRFSANGARAGAEFRINITTYDNQYLPDVAALADGGFVVTWTHGLNPQSQTDVYLRRADALGNAVTGDVLVNGTTAGNQDNSKVVALGDGGFLVLWQSQGQDGSGYGLYARRYTAAGVAQPEFRINTTTAGDQSQPAVAVLGDGGLVVAWQSAGQDGSGSGIVLQRYDALGQAVGGEVVVNTTTAGAQTAPDVIALADGGYLVGWVSANQDGSGLGIYAQRFDAVGNRVGGEIAVTQATLGDQVEPAFAATADGGWIATWSGYNPATGTLDVMQRRFTVAEVTVTVTAPDRVLAVGQPVAAATLFSVASDAPAGTGVVIQSYEFTDLSVGGGHFLLDGVTQAANTPIVLAGDQLHRLTYVANATTGGHDTIRVRAFDGTSWAEDTAALAATAPRATVVAGAESRVNTHTPSSQGAPDVTVLPNGNHVVTWHSLGQDGSSYGIYAQLYRADGTPVDGEVRVNSYTANAQHGERVTALPDGGFLIVWHSEGQDGSVWGTHGQRFAADGTRVGGEFRVNAGTPDNQYLPSMAGLADGGFVVTWTHGLYLQSTSDVYLRRFDAFGNAVTGDVLVNGTTAGNQDNSEVIALGDGGFLVLWQSQGQDGSGYGLYARRYTAAGVAQPEFRINTTTAGDQSQPAVAVLGDGGLVVAWQSAGQDGSGSGIVLQRYDALGQAVGGEVVVNTTTAGAQTAPDVIALADGGYLVGWVSANQDGSGLGIYAQRFDAVGNRVGGEIAVTQATLGDQAEPAFAATADGGWIATWSGYNPATGTLDVMQRRFTVAEAMPEFITIHGTPGADVLTGTPLQNHILGYEGDDKLSGSTSRDTLDGGEGADTLSGGAGDDVYIVDNVRDVVRELVNEGVDEVRTSLNSYTLGANLERLTFIGTGNFAGTGNTLDNMIVGGSGNDTLTGGAGADTLIGGDGDDRFYFDDADAPLQGGAGFDTAVVQGSVGASLDLAACSIEQAYGGGGDDSLIGTGALLGLAINGRDGDDLILGSAFNDTLTGGNGSDTLIAGDGDDVLYIDADDALVSGGAGFDTVYVQGDGNLTLDLTASGIERVFSGSGNDILTATGSVTLVEINGGAGDDLLVGSAFDDTLRGDAGNDTLYGGDGNDVLVGGSGDNVLFGGAGDDRLYVDTQTASLDGGAGNDTVYARYSGGVTLDLSASIELFSGSVGSDTVTAVNASAAVELIGGDGDDSLTGGAYADSLRGDNGNDWLDGGDGNDTLSGGNGNDWLLGGGGNDTLSGGSGNDTLIGGFGDDSLVGGSGADLFVFSNGGGNDILRDFNAGQGDLIGLAEGQTYTLAADVSGNVQIVFGASDTVTLVGVQITAVSSSWFVTV